MTICLLDLIGKWISILFIGFLSLFHMENMNEVATYGSQNANIRKDVSVYSEIIPYTKKVYYDATLNSKTEKNHYQGC